MDLHSESSTKSDQDMKSWKIGAVAGLIAGIVAGIVETISAITFLTIGLGYLWLPPPPNAPILIITATGMVVNIIWGVFLGIVYAKIYDLVPGKSISKSLLFGLICYFIYDIRGATYYLFYGDILTVISQISWIFTWIAYALVLGFIYEFLRSRYFITKERLKIIKYDIKNGIHPGAIAGLLGGISAFITIVIGIVMEFWPPSVPDPDIGFFLSQLGTHAFFNMIWGIVFGMLFAMFYDRIPGKGIKKGIVYSLTLFFITTFRGSIYGLPYGNLIFYSFSTISFFHFLTVGLVLGLLYRKPTEVIAVKKEKIKTVKLENCRHCNASMLKGSKFCNKCGKKQ